MKKGQITIFIIIGLVLLVSAGLVIYFTTRAVVKPVEEEIIVPEDVRPVHSLVQQCAQSTAREGIGLLGLQGGFIQIPGIIERTPSAYVPADSHEEFKVPLWQYEGEDRTPSIGFMERELSRHISQRIKECTAGFEELTGRYEVKEEGNISVRTTLTDDDVVVKVTWPLALTTPERTTRINEFITRVPVRLKQIWELANATLSAENKHSYFENATIDLMAADSEKIPLDGFTLECGTKRWRIPEIRQRLQEVLYYNIPATRIKNTAHWPFLAKTSTYETLHKDYLRMTKELEQGKTPKEPRTEAPDDAYQYFKLYLDIGTRPTELTAGFEYQPEWGMHLAAQPNEGATLKSNSGKGAKWLRFLCINQWHFTYDIIYPIKATIRDPSAFDGQGYNFQYAFPVLINKNAPARENFGLSRFQSIDFGAEDFCTTYGTERADIRVLGELPGVPVLMELSDAKLGYSCFNQECELGTTQAIDGIYRYYGYLPGGCTNPLISAEKEGYLPARAQLLDDRLDIKLKKLQDLNLKVVVHPYHGQTKTWAMPRPLKENERISLRISTINTTFEQFIGFPTQNQTLQLVQEDAHYEIDAILTLRDKQIGGYNTPMARLAYDDFAGKTAAVIHVVEYLPVPITDQQKLEMIQYIMEGAYRDELQPTFE
jgi:hypothetical protein